MVAITHSVVCRLQKSWEVMLSMLLMMPFHSTIQLAAMLAMIAHEPSDVHHTRPISSNQHEEDLGSIFALKCSVPDLQPLLLKCDQMLKPRKQERVEVLGIMQARNKSPNKHVVLLVAQHWREIQENPDVDPAS